MSTPAQGPVRNTVNRVAAGVSRWRNTRRGTSTLKASYAQAARDVKRMDPAVRQAIGRSNMMKADLQVLAEAQVVGAVRPGDQAFAQVLSDRATSRVEAVGASAPPTRNPVRMVGNRISRWRDTRQGTARLKAAYTQAARDVKRTDPTVREAIGRSRINKSDLTHFSKTQMEATFRPEGRQVPGQPQIQTQVQGQAPAQVQGQTPVQVQGQTPAQVQGQAPAQTQAQTPAQVQAQQQGQAQAASAGGQPERAARLGARLGGAVGSVSRWAKEVRSKTTTAAQQFSAAYTARRQNPAARNQTPQRTTWTAPGQQPNQVAAAAQPTPIQATATPAQTTPAQATPSQPTPAPATPAQAAPAQVAAAQIPVSSSAEKPEGLVAFKADTSRASAAAFSGTAGDPAQSSSTSDPQLSPSQQLLARVEGQATGARMDEDPQQALAGNAPPGSATPADPAKPASNLGEATGSTSHNKHRKPDSREV